MASLPGWNSIDSTTRIHNFLEIAGIVFLGLLVLAESFAYRYGKQRDALIEQAAHVAKTQRDAEEKAAEDRHAQEIQKLKADEKAVEERHAAEIQRLKDATKGQLSEEEVAAFVEALKANPARPIIRIPRRWCRGDGLSAGTRSRTRCSGLQI
jgi:predicted Holliday junction resolvase-like endonuclease